MGIESWGARRKILNASSKIVKTLSADEMKHLKQKDEFAQDSSVLDFEKELQEVRAASKDLVIDGKSLEYLQKLGAGAAGEVYKVRPPFSFHLNLHLSPTGHLSFTSLSPHLTSCPLPAHPCLYSFSSSPPLGSLSSEASGDQGFEGDDR